MHGIHGIKAESVYSVDVQIATFLTDFFSADAVMADGPVATKLLFSPYRRFEAWRFLTYMFVHVG
jgi:rhomboid-related protein 1/2/3